MNFGTLQSWDHEHDTEVEFATFSNHAMVVDDEEENVRHQKDSEDDEDNDEETEQERLERIRVMLLNCKVDPEHVSKSFVSVSCEGTF